MKYSFVFLMFMIIFSLTAQEHQGMQPMVLVTGEGIVKVVPDQVLIKSRIENEGSNAQEVKKQNDAVVDRIIKYLKAEGIPEKNIQTDYINLNKNYNYEDKTYSYVANQSISIQLDNLKNYEKIMSGLLQAGLNRVDGIQFKSSQMDGHIKEARRLAVLNAKMKAEEYAAPLGQSIGKAVSINEIESAHYPILQRQEMMKAGYDTGEQETIAPGEMEVRTKVTIVFRLN
ncbi:hypothetical protein BH23BAC2_BH23BAC2_09450 [soil metagenome]